MSPRGYRIVTSLLAPALPFFLRWRAAKGKEDRARLGERFGRTRAARPAGELIWLHGASVGETQMLRPLIDRLLATKPDRHILITSGTTTSAALLGDALPARAIHQYLPVDTPGATQRFIAHWKPDLAVFAESELWPNLIAATADANIPLALINARMNSASIDGWAKRPALARSVLRRFNLILAADTRTAEGLAPHYDRAIDVIGSLKFDAPALSFDSAERDRLRTLIGDRPVWLAASTHEAEEDVFAALQAKVPDALMLWLPRHPERGPEIAARMNAPLRSVGAAPTDAPVYVMDTLGEMGLALSLSDVCLMGGSFEPTLKGHNPLEAARAGVPVLTGPHIDSFSGLYESMVNATAAIVVSEDNAPAMIQKGLDGRLSGMAEDAAKFAAAHKGAMATTQAALEDLLRAN